MEGFLFILYKKIMIWIFGDSYSTSFNHLSTRDFWAKDYISWKGYVPKTFGEIISDELNMEVIYKSKNSFDNDSIFESIYENAHLIKKDDIIIIGWSSTVRCRLSNDSNQWINIIPNRKFSDYELSNISKQTLEDILINRTSPLYKDEFIKRRDFLNWLFKDMVLIHWTPFVDQFDFTLGYKNITTIKSETNGEINDGHYSETGHVLLSKNFMDLIKYDNIRKFGNSNEIGKKNNWKRLL